MAFNSRVLVIDDDVEIREAFRTILTGDGGALEGPSLELDRLFAGVSGSAGPTAGNAGTAADRRVFDVEFAGQGETGFEMVRMAAGEGENPYAVIFLDIRMPPGWDGVRTAREIRRVDPLAQIVIVTAYADATISKIVEQVGFTDRLLYLKKPFDDEEILQLADSLSMRWNLERKVRGFMVLLEGIIDGLSDLKISDDDREFRSSFEGILRQVGELLDTEDVFLAKIANGEFQFRIGLGRFANGITEGEAFREIVSRVLSQDRVDGVFHLDKYVVMPVMFRSCRNVVVGIRTEREVEGAGRLLEVLASNASRILEMGSHMGQMRTRIETLRQREESLLAKVRSLEGFLEGPLEGSGAQP